MRSERIVWALSGLLAMSGTSVWAQTEPGAGRPGRPPRGEFRRGQMRDPVETIKQLRGALSKELQLTEEQKQVINALFADQEKELTELRAQADQKREQHAEELRQLREQREAAEGDRAKQRELERRIRELNAPPAEIAESNQRFYAAVKEELTDEQRPIFDRLVARVSAGGPFVEFAAIRRALRDLELTDDQQTRVEEIQRKHVEVMRQAQAEGPEAIDALLKQFRQEILAELTQEQKAQFAAAEEKYKNEPMGPGGPGGRGERRRPRDR
jgi:Spy/CpxP family protein refolding chaperone